MPNSQKKICNPILWDLFCISTVVGIWPRFIEPKVISTTRLNLPIRNLPKPFDGFKILQISDLHFSPNSTDSFLDRLVNKCKALKPDLITLTGDFLCYGQLLEPQRLSAFLNRFKAPYGCFAVLGNHDYSSCVSINSDGDYDIVKPTTSSLGRALQRLYTNVTLTKRTTDSAKNTPLHEELVSLIKRSPFHLLHNTTESICIEKTKLNITGFGEYILGRIDTQAAYQNYDPSYPGIILLHNPDGAPLLHNHYGDIILSGHTHGGQVNLPWLWKKFTLLENMDFKKGLVKNHGKWLYINRGIGSVMPFRWFSKPEILLLTLEPAS